MVILATAGSARAERQPEVEVASGTAFPLGSGDYDEQFSDIVKLGVRGVLFAPTTAEPWRLGVELAVDGMSLERKGWADLGTKRFRGLGGARLEYRLTSHVRLFTRALAGIDYYRTAEFSFQPPGDPAALQTVRATGWALAFELGAGAQVALGPVVVGAQVGLPMAFYSLDGASSTSSFGGPYQFSSFIHEATYDLDVLGTLGVTF